MPDEAAFREAAFWAEVRGLPADPAPKLVFADWLAERGRDPLAHALRWCAARGRHPHVSPAGKSVYWQRGSRGARGTFNLPGPVFDRLRGKRRRPVLRVYLTARAAFEALAAALEELRRLWEVPAGPSGELHRRPRRGKIAGVLPAGSRRADPLRYL
jgi:uncharacterized protein (TIGR02996 family)